MYNAAYIQEKNFDNLLADTPLLLVYFTASWCGPCRLTAPLVDRLAKDYENRVTVVKVDIEQNKSISQKLNVLHIPTVLFFNYGELVATCIGGAPYDEYQNIIEQYLENPENPD
ncbi:MAG: thioredoxin family protein [Spirulina sp.]